MAGGREGIRMGHSQDRSRKMATRTSILVQQGKGTLRGPLEWAERELLLLISAVTQPVGVANPSTIPDTPPTDFLHRNWRIPFLGIPFFSICKRKRETEGEIPREKDQKAEGKV